MANKKTETRQEVKGKVAITKGMAKAGKLAGKAQGVPAQGNRQGLKGSNKSLKKAIDKTTSKRDPIQKHPLVRNAGEPSAEGKYRKNRGSAVPVKNGRSFSRSVFTGSSSGKVGINYTK